MQNDKDLFAPLMHYVKELARALRRPTTEVKKSLFVVSAEKIRAFHSGLGPHSWMGGGGAYKPPRYCGECGKPFPWTETALEAAREYADDLDQLSSEEKAKLKATFDDLTIDTIRTPLAANRFKKFMTKVGPAAGGVLQKILEAVATEAAKKSMGL